MSAIHQDMAVDPIDAVLSPMFVASSLATTGLATITVFGYSFSDALYTASGSTITIGLAIGMFALVAAWLTNQVNTRDWEREEFLIVTLMLGSQVAIALVPVVRDFVLGSQVVAIPVVAVQAAGYYLIAYY